jgi:hypothetical protein
LVALQGFTACCGADVLYGFGVGPGVKDPNGISGYKSDGMNYLRDAEGKQIPITFADKFRADFEKQQRAYPSRAYVAIVNTQQYEAHNQAWPKLMKEMGFEFVRSWYNSVHAGNGPLYMFVLCTDGKGRSEVFTQPPKGWEDLPGGVQTTEVAKAA